MFWISALELACKLFGKTEQLTGYLARREAKAKSMGEANAQNAINQLSDDDVVKQLHDKYDRD